MFLLKCSEISASIDKHYDMIAQFRKKVNYLKKSNKRAHKNLLRSFDTFKTEKHTNLTNTKSYVVQMCFTAKPYQAIWFVQVPA